MATTAREYLLHSTNVQTVSPVNRVGTLNQKRSQISIARFRYPAKLLFSSTAVLR